LRGQWAIDTGRSQIGRRCTCRADLASKLACIALLTLLFQPLGARAGDAPLRSIFPSLLAIAPGPESRATQSATEEQLEGPAIIYLRTSEVIFPADREARGNRGQLRIPPSSALRPHAVSGFVNLRAGIDTFGDADHLLQRPRADLDGAVNLNGWVLESRGSFARVRARPWRLGETRLVRDFPRQSTRFEAGDLHPSITGFQSGFLMQGMAVSKRFDLQPLRRFTPTGTREFRLERPAVVEVSVNGDLARRLELPAGRYDLRDLDLGSGINDVRLRVRDDQGTVELIDFGIAFEPTLLAPGTHHFSYAVGRHQRSVRDPTLARRDRIVASGLHRVGLTNSLTAGLNLQTDVYATTFGAEATWATTFGTLRADVALSHSRVRPDDFAARLRYDHLDLSRRNVRKRLLSFALETRGRNFVGIGRFAAPSPVGAQLTARLEQDVYGPRTRGSFELRYLAGRGSITDTTTGAARVTRRLREGAQGALDLELGVERRWTSDGIRSLRTLFRLTWIPASSNQVLSLTHDPQSQATQLDWTLTPRDANRGWNAHTRLTRRDRGEELTTNLGFVHDRFEAGVQHATGLGTRSGRGGTAHGNLRVATALSFAGGYLGWSRPITQSFAILPDSSSGRALPQRVIPNLPPYLESELPSHLLPDDRLLLSPARPNAKVFPTYRSGVIYRPGASRSDSTHAGTAPPRSQ